MKKGFTLIELLAVIVILAIIALIATPLVLNTIEKARKGAAKASANTYIHTVETAVASHMIKNNSTSPVVGNYSVSTLKNNFDVTFRFINENNEEITRKIEIKLKTKEV